MPLLYRMHSLNFSLVLTPTWNSYLVISNRPTVYAYSGESLGFLQGWMSF